MYPDRLESQISLARDNPKATIIYGLIDVISYDGSRVVIPRLAPTVEFFVRPVMEDHPRYRTDPPLLIGPSVMLFSRETAIKVGLFDTSYNPFHTEDTDFCFRLWHLGPFKGIDRPLSMYRQASSAFFAKKRHGMVAWYQARKNQNLFFRNWLNCIWMFMTGKAWENSGRSRRSFCARHPMTFFLTGTEVEVARRLLGRAIQAKPLDYKNWKWFLRTWYPRTRLEKCLKRELLPTCLNEDVPDLTLFDRLFQLPHEATGKNLGPRLVKLFWLFVRKPEKFCKVFRRDELFQFFWGVSGDFQRLHPLIPGEKRAGEPFPVFELEGLIEKGSL